MINPQSVLDVPMEENDAGAATIREYLIALLLRVWDEEEGFDGKRPFGNSGWPWDLMKPLIQAGVLSGTLDEYGYIDVLTPEEEERGQRLVHAAIISLGWVQSPEPPAFA